MSGEIRMNLQDELLEKPTFVRLKFLGTGAPDGKQVPRKGSLRDVRVRSLEDLVDCVDDWLGAPGSWQLSTAANWPLTNDAFRRPTSKGCPLVVNVRNTQEMLLRRLEELTAYHERLEGRMQREAIERAREVRDCNMRLNSLEEAVEELGHLPRTRTNRGAFYCKSVPMLLPLFASFMLCVVVYWMKIIDDEVAGQTSVMGLRIQQCEDRLSDFNDNLNDIKDDNTNVNTTAWKTRGDIHHLRWHLQSVESELNRSLVAGERLNASLRDVHSVAMTAKADAALASADEQLEAEQIQRVRDTLSKTLELAMDAKFGLIWVNATLEQHSLQLSAEKCFAQSLANDTDARLNSLRAAADDARVKAAAAGEAADDAGVKAAAASEAAVAAMAAARGAQEATDQQEADLKHVQQGVTAANATAAGVEQQMTALLRAASSWRAACTHAARQASKAIAREARLAKLEAALEERLNASNASDAPTAAGQPAAAAQLQSVKVPPCASAVSGFGPGGINEAELDQLRERTVPPVA